MHFDLTKQHYVSPIGNTQVFKPIANLLVASGEKI